MIEPLLRLATARPERACEVERGRTGVALAAGTGVAMGAGVGHVVTIFFHSALAGSALGALALLCTGAGVVAAMRARSDAAAVGWALLSNVGPPTTVFAVTVIGLCFAVPAGLAAFACVAPVVLFGRRLARSERSAGACRERLLGGAVALSAALALCALEVSTAGDTSTLVPAGFALGTAVALVLAAAWPDLRRALVVARLRDGQLPGWRELAPFELSRAIEGGDGPHRTGWMRLDLGPVDRSDRRLLAAAALLAGVHSVAAPCWPRPSSAALNGQQNVFNPARWASCRPVADTCRPRSSPAYRHCTV